MDMIEAMHDYILLFEYLPIEDSTDDVLVATAIASNHDQEWTVVVNANLEEERIVDDVPTPGAQPTIQPSQALIFLGESHAGIIGAGAGEFYDDRFDTPEGELKEQFMADIRSKFD